MKDVIKGVAEKIITVLVIVCLLAGGGYFAYKKINNKVDNLVTDSKETDELQILKEKLQATAELNTAEYMCTYSKRYSDAKKFKKWKIPGTKNSFTIQYDGIVKAGIKDLTKAEIKEKDGKTLVIVMPAVEITYYKIDKDTLKVLEESNNIFNSIKVEDINAAQKDLELEMAKRAEKNGILEQARENAEVIIRSMLMDADNSYTIEFEWDELEK